VLIPFSRIRFCAALTLLAALPAAGATARLVDVSTTVSAPDSITVGERFSVTRVFSFPDSLTMSVPREIEPGTCRILSLVWSEDKSRGRTEKAAKLTLITLDLQQAKLPAMAVEFYTPSRDTLVAFAKEVVVPVRRLAAPGAQTRPLKGQWEAPRRYWPWIAAGAALLVAALVLWWWLRRRARRGVEAPSEPALPPDYVAMTELTRIARLNLLERGEFKTYYTLVTNAVRRYIEARFGVQAMDRTTGELLAELENGGRRVDNLHDLLTEADLAKFAKYRPGKEAGEAAMSSAREIIVKSTPRHPQPRETEATGEEAMVGAAVSEEESV
jgi:hypothetical protein